MKQSQHIKALMNTLDEYYPKDVVCYLNHKNAYELLIATILSAQCTDDRVNQITPALFERYPTPFDLAEADLKEVEDYIRSGGFYKTKSKNIVGCAKGLVENYNGEVPLEIEELTKLPGVGRKTANVVRGNIYKIPSIVVDTHVKRITLRWGLTKSDNPVTIEHDLMELLPKEHWIRYNTQVIAHGRAICTARAPKCEGCMFLSYCPFGLNKMRENLPEEVIEREKAGKMY